MFTDLKQSRIYVGYRQSVDAVRCGNVKKAYIAKDADEHIVLQFCELCKECGVEVIFADSKKMLGKVCGINVSAACAVVLK